MQDRDLLFVGDFNAPLYSSGHNTDDRSITVSTFSEILELKQFNDIVNCNSRMLDLVLTNLYLSPPENAAGLVDVDPYHPPLLIYFGVKSPRPHNFGVHDSHKEFNFKKADFRMMYEMIGAQDWSGVMGAAHPDEACDALYSVFNTIFIATVPYKKLRTRRFPHWYTSELIKLIRMKERCHQRYKRYNRANDFDQFRSLRSIIKSRTKILYRNFISSAERSISDDPRSFWAFIQDRKGYTRIPGVVKDGDISYSSPAGVVGAFADFFGSVYAADDYVNSDGIEEICDQNFISVESVSDGEVRLAARKLSNKLTAGPDLIPSFVVKDCIGVLVLPLKHIYDLILKTSTFPTRWKAAKIIPVLKKGDSSIISNYGPISILCNFSKLFEIILFNAIYPRVRSSVAAEQHGFMKKRSCSTNLITFSQFVYEKLDLGGQSPLRFACSVVNSLADRCDLHSQSLVHICDLYLNENI
ncbi:uncharacterized protein LOC123673311 [Harmonia axyridis]|uniref:uncharacterized protein LOC123673311 n=1 Tax=Harmonia axyridis TaxID=115357 RepID=UPI001E2754B6|nr:uncharacterized protein LOC123673311 [Harmonia axyridis]